MVIVNRLWFAAVFPQFVQKPGGFAVCFLTWAILCHVLVCGDSAQAEVRDPFALVSRTLWAPSAVLLLSQVPGWLGATVLGRGACCLDAPL